jgi:hypothetical protein
MSGIGDFFLGSRPQYGTLPGYDKLLEGIQGYDPKIGFAGKMAKKQLKALYSGDDISDLGQFNSIRQKEAADLAGTDMDYATGANALIANSGAGDQPGLLNRSLQSAKERVRQNAGMQSVDALNNFQTQANQTYGNAYQNQQGNQQAKFGMWGNALQNSLYDKSRKGGFLSQLPGMLAGAGSMMTGAGALK